MGCNCKNKNNGNLPNESENDKTFGDKIVVFLFKVLLFVFVSILVSVVIIPFSIYVIYNAIFRDGTLNVENFITNSKKYFNKNNAINNHTPKPNVVDSQNN